MFNNYTNPYMYMNRNTQQMTAPNYNNMPYQPMQRQIMYESPFQDVRLVNEKEANEYIVLPNSKALLMDVNAKTFWIKSADSLGKLTIEKYNFEKVEDVDEQPQVAPINTEMFATKDDLSALTEQITKLEKQIKINQILAEKPITKQEA